MDLTELASSQAPNAIAMGGTVALSVAALATKDRLRWLYIALSLVMAGIILAKNFSYKSLVAGVEGSLDAHRSYAEALLWVIVAQLSIAVILVLMASLSKRVTWLAVAAGMACFYAALCMAGWRTAYRGTSPDIGYVLWSPPLHWVALGALVVTTVLAVVLLARRRRPTVLP